MANVLCLDFDDTIVTDNTSRLVFEEFGATAWAAIEEAYQVRRMSVEQQNAAALDAVEASEEELREFVRANVEVRPGFLELIDWARWHDWEPVVVSNGFDFAVDTVLDDLGLDRVVRHCGRTRFAYRWRVKYESPRGIEVAEGFKLSYAAAFKSAGDFVAYVGDGASDVEAARLAAVVFARDTLLAKLTGEHPRVYRFETFHDVIGVLEGDSEGWAGER